MSKGRVCHLGMASSIHVQRWVNYFAEKGWDVELITFQSTIAETLNPKIKLHVVKPGNIPIIRFFKAKSGIIKHLKMIQPDIIHAHSIPAFGIYAGLYAKKGGNEPIIVNAWGFYHINTHRGMKRKLDKLCLERAKIVAGTSWQMRDALVESFGIPKEKFVMFSWGIDTKIFFADYKEEINKTRIQMNIEDDASVIISPRNMSPYYRIQNILKAASKVIEKHPKTIFIFLRGFGSEEFENEMKQEAKNLKIEGNVRFISRLLSPREMAIYLTLSDIMISNSKTDQMSSVILEGMACGTIPVLSDIEIYKTHIEHEKNGFFIDGEDIDELEKTISYCLEHLEIKEEFARINKTLIIEKEDWYKNAKKMEEVYEKVLNR